MEDERTICIQLVDARGDFNMTGLDAFVKATRLSECGLSYAVVSILGPQSSGKSTLVNHLFYSKFKEMDALVGRKQTTQGIWIAKAVDIDPCTLILDLEGTDAGERGEDGTAFEKQSALFALAISDIILINMWCHDIGRDHASNKPLLKTVFQVMMRLFTPRKSTLLFIIRDKTKTPMEILDPILRDDVQKVEIVALPNFEEKEDQFKEQVAFLRQCFFGSIAPGGLAGDRRAVVPGSGFPFSIREIWNVIKANKDLDLPAHKIMVATVRCEEIAHEKLMKFSSDKEWQTLETDAKTSPVPGFGKKLTTLLDKYLLEYDDEVTFFEESVRTTKRQMMLEKTLLIAYPSYQAVLEHHRSNALKKFKNDLRLYNSSTGFSATVHHCIEACLADFDRGSADANVEMSGWDFSKTRERLFHDLQSHAADVQAQKLAEVAERFEKRMQDALSEPIAVLLDTGTSETWPAIRNLLAQQSEAATAELSAVLSGFELDKEVKHRMLKNVHESGLRIVEKKAKEAANQGLIRIKERFSTAFTHDAESMPRVWTGKEDMRTIIRDARLSALRLLSTLAAMRLDDKCSDNIDSALASSLLDGTERAKDDGFTTDRSFSSSPLYLNTWEGVPETDILLTPVQCRKLWQQLNAETEYIINQALATQEASRRERSSWLPPTWAIIAMVVLGFNEFMTLLKNPLYLILSFVLWLIGRVIWMHFDFVKEFQHGVLRGVISVASKLVPTVMNILKKLAEEGEQLSADHSSHKSAASSNTLDSGGYHKDAPLHDNIADASSNGSTSEDAYSVSEVKQ